MFVKICGITSEDDALTAAAMGADAVGLNFVASSARKITTARARDIARRLPPEILTVGIFRDEAPERVVDIASTVGLRAVQLHGSESPDDVKWVTARIPNVIKALPWGHPNLWNFMIYGRVRLMIDAAEGGSGQVIDWADVASRPPDAPFILAGGLSPTNVAKAIETCGPWGVDVASGVEERPGHKDPVKVREFVATARSAALKRAETASDSGSAQHPDPGADPAADPFDWEVDL